MEIETFTKKVSAVARANKDFNKIFGIGWNKTGTTTLATVLELYGYALPDQMTQEVRLNKQTFNTNYAEMADFCSRYDAFQDLPFSQGLTYVAADALFPNSKFILTERDPDAWFQSVTSSFAKNHRLANIADLTEQDLLSKVGYLYPGYLHENKRRLLSSFQGGQRTVLWEKLYDKDYYIDHYENRNTEIKRYFASTQNKLLVIDMTEEKSTATICQFLNIPHHFAIEMPHSNKTSPKPL